MEERYSQTHTCISNTLMYYILVNPISLEPSRAELIRRLDLMVVHYGPHSPLNFDACGKLNMVARADFVLSVPIYNTLMYYYS